MLSIKSNQCEKFYLFLTAHLPTFYEFEMLFLKLAVSVFTSHQLLCRFKVYPEVEARNSIPKPTICPSKACSSVSYFLFLFRFLH